MAFLSLAPRESRPTTRRPLNLTAARRVRATAQRFAVRTRRPFWQELNPDFPGPTAPALGERNLEGGRGHVKAMFPLAERGVSSGRGRTAQWNFR